jgi:hypothetical protein
MNVYDKHDKHDKHDTIVDNDMPISRLCTVATHPHTAYLFHLVYSIISLFISQLIVLITLDVSLIHISVFNIPVTRVVLHLFLIQNFLINYFIPVPNYSNSIQHSTGKRLVMFYSGAFYFN